MSFLHPLYNFLNFASDVSWFEYEVKLDIALSVIEVAAEESDDSSSTS